MKIRKQENQTFEHVQDTDQHKPDKNKDAHKRKYEKDLRIENSKEENYEYDNLYR